MKLVINRCYGGFSLSHEAVLEYGRRKGIELHAFVDTRDGGKRGMKPYVPGKERVFCIHYFKSSDPEEGPYFSAHDIPRDDPVLVALVEEWGAKANGECAKLAIVEIPDGIEWEIDEYDGVERVDEAHRSWA